MTKRTIVTLIMCVAALSSVELSAGEPDTDEVDRFFDACMRHCTATIRTMLEKNPDLINARNAQGYTTLWFSDGPTAELLISKGADVNAKAKSGDTPLHNNGVPAVARLLLQHGADVNARNNAQAIPLHNAAYDTSTTELVEILLAAGADVRAKDKYGNTPLHCARSAAMATVLTARGRKRAQQMGRNAY